MADKEGNKLTKDYAVDILPYVDVLKSCIRDA